MRRFHELFFTLSPEKSAIEHNVKRALLLADRSAYNYYADFAEKGFYNRIIAGNIHQGKQRDGAHAGNDLPAAQREPLGRQSERVHHRGIHDTGEQGHQKHGEIGVWER